METHVFLGSVKPTKRDQNNLFMVMPYDIGCRIITSFLPPFRSHDKVYVDLLGPLLAIVFLAGFVSYGNTLKLVQIQLTPVEFILCYSFLMPSFCFCISKLGKSDITFVETVSIVGYSVYGHLFTLLASFFCFHETNNFFFFLCLAFLGGLSTFRMVVIFLRSIEAPGARLVICATIAILNILSLVFIHFAYMHRSYVYINV